MWLAKRQQAFGEGGKALTGPVTVPGSSAGVWLEGERRGVTVYAPGGYHWVPALGDEVLVLKAGQRGEKPCALGLSGGDDLGLKPGEVAITAGAAVLRLSLDGTVDITGRLTVNGMSVKTEDE